jgi:queuine/archaeosine tRNA-ribosyltransferase
MEIQAALGSDIAMVLDECVPYPCEYDYAAKSADLTARWGKEDAGLWKEENAQRPTPNAQRPTEESAISNQQSAIDRHLLFGIVQGGTFDDLRRASAQAIVELNFDGYAIGGVSVGEPEEGMMRAVESAEPLFASGQTALRDGTRHAAANAGNGRARDRHVRLRLADTPRPERNRIHSRRRAQFKERRVRDG